MVMTLGDGLRRGKIGRIEGADQTAHRMADKNQIRPIRLMLNLSRLFFYFDRIFPDRTERKT